MATKKENKKSKASSEKRSWIRSIIMGEFLNYKFFTRNFFYVAAVVGVFIAFISCRYRVQSCLSQVIALKTELNNANAEKVKAMATYNSLIREPEMRRRANDANLNLSMPDTPPYQLD